MKIEIPIKTMSLIDLISLKKEIEDEFKVRKFIEKNLKKL